VIPSTPGPGKSQKNFCFSHLIFTNIEK
jgi:hypothetical protein